MAGFFERAAHHEPNAIVRRPRDGPRWTHCNKSVTIVVNEVNAEVYASTCSCDEVQFRIPREPVAMTRCHCVPSLSVMMDPPLQNCLKAATHWIAIAVLLAVSAVSALFGLMGERVGIVW